MIERTLPIRTVSEANRRGHWAKHARRTADQRRAVLLAFRPAILAAKWTLPVRVTIVRIAPRALDGHDNLCAALKACADGITDALGLKSDRAAGLSFVYGQERGAPKTYGVRITLEAT